MSKENLVKTPTERVRRKPLERRNRLKVKGEDPNYVYRIVNDEHDRIQEFLDYGWEFETSEDVRVGGSRVDDTSKLGKVREIPVGQSKRAVLMKIRRDWYEEDQKAKEDYLKQTEAAMQPDPSVGTYGPGLKVERK